MHIRPGRANEFITHGQFLNNGGYEPEDKCSSLPSFKWTSVRCRLHGILYFLDDSKPHLLQKWSINYSPLYSLSLLIHFTLISLLLFFLGIFSTNEQLVFLGLSWIRQSYHYSIQHCVGVLYYYWKPWKKDIQANDTCRCYDYLIRTFKIIWR